MSRLTVAERNLKSWMRAEDMEAEDLPHGEVRNFSSEEIKQINLLIRQGWAEDAAIRQIKLGPKGDQ